MLKVYFILLNEITYPFYLFWNSSDVKWIFISFSTTFSLTSLLALIQLSVSSLKKKKKNLGEIHQRYLECDLNWSVMNQSNKYSLNTFYSKETMCKPAQSSEGDRRSQIITRGIKIFRKVQKCKMQSKHGEWKKVEQAK